MEKKLKVGVGVNIAFAVAIIVATFCYILIDCSEYITKTIVSGLFVLCGIFNLLYSRACLKSGYKNGFGYCLMAGLALACVGDILLIDFFVLGAIFFAAGHVMFFIAFCFESKFRVRDIIIGALIFVCAFLVIEFYKGFDFEGMKVLIVVYALIISLMLGKAISNMFNLNDKSLKLVSFVGALLFFISDLMLLFHVFGSGAYVFDVICVSTYYPAEFLLAFSIFVCAVCSPKSPSRHDLKKQNAKSN